jgi:3,4-dihydroxy-2-butanone 4-phosphate synthase
VLPGRTPPFIRARAFGSRALAATPSCPPLPAHPSQDDADRENEGDFIGAAATATPAAVATMLRYCTGVVCAALPPERAEALGLRPMVPENRDPFKTAFTVSVDAATGTTTGISASDRAATVRALADAGSTPATFSAPGHVFPLAAKEGGVLARGGHTEASVDLCRLAGLPPVGYLCEVCDTDTASGVLAKAAAASGSDASSSSSSSSSATAATAAGGSYEMLRFPALQTLAGALGMPLVTIADLQRYRYRREVLLRADRVEALEGDAMPVLPQEALSAAARGRLTRRCYRFSSSALIAAAGGDSSTGSSSSANEYTVTAWLTAPAGDDAAAASPAAPPQPPLMLAQFPGTAPSARGADARINELAAAVAAAGDFSSDAPGGTVALVSVVVTGDVSQNAPGKASARLDSGSSDSNVPGGASSGSSATQQHHHHVSAYSGLYPTPQSVAAALASLRKQQQQALKAAGGEPAAAGFYVCDRVLAEMSQATSAVLSALAPAAPSGDAPVGSYSSSSSSSGGIGAKGSVAAPVPVPVLPAAAAPGGGTTDETALAAAARGGWPSVILLVGSHDDGDGSSGMPSAGDVLGALRLWEYGLGVRAAACLSIE